MSKIATGQNDPSAPVHETPVAIIGAGPVALFAAFELGLLDIAATLIDVLDKPGGQCAELYPEKPIYDIPGLPVITGQGLTDQLLTQIAPFKPHFLLGRTVTNITHQGAEQYRLHLSDGSVVIARAVVIATGGGLFSPKKLPFPEAASFEGKSVHYALRDRSAMTGKDILIAGGGDSAVDWALDLLDVARSITLTHRRDVFRAAPARVAQVHDFIKAGRIKLVIGQPHTIHGKNGQLTHVTISTDEGPQDVACEQMLVFYGLTMRPGPLADFGIECVDGLVPVDTEKFATNRPGVYAIGDICTYPGKLKLILSGFHEGALMANAVFRYLYPDKKWRFQYTTTSSDLQKKLGVAASTGGHTE